MRKGNVSALFLVLTSSVGCSESPSELQLLFGGRFVFEVEEMAMHPSGYVPGDALPDSLYVETQDGRRHDVEFSTDGEKVTIRQDLPCRWIHIGDEESIEDEHTREYELEEGCISGGRFVVRTVGERVEAELTRYGSGVPIISSERGRLISELGQSD